MIDTTLPDWELQGAASSPRTDAIRQRVAERLFGADATLPSLPHLQLRERIGEGAAGEVYLAHDPRLERDVAVKLLRPIEDGAAEQRRLNREARMLARLTHPNVVHIYEVGNHEGQLYIVTEYVRGGSLLSWQSSGRRRLQEILRFYRDAAAGLAAAHALGIVHRDMKPANVLVADDGRGCVADFGLARSIDDAGPLPSIGEDASASPERSSLLATASRGRGGTPAYMAPETVREGVSDPRTDQFAWGIALYEALFGRRPFELPEAASSTTRPALVLPARSVNGEAVPSYVRRLLDAALAWSPEHRMRSMNAIVDVLEHTPAKLRRRRGMLLAGAGVVVAAGAGWLVGTEPARCRPASTDLVDVWDDATRAEVRAAFTATGASFAGDAATYAAASLDEYAREWAEAKTATCEATRVEHSRSDESFDLAMACFDARRARLRAVTESLRNVDLSVIAAIDRVVATLPEIASCSDLDRLRRDPTLALDPAHNELARAIREELASARIVDATGDPSRATTLGDAALARAEQLGDPSLLAEAWLVRAQIERDKETTAAAHAAALTALDHAEIAGHDQVTAQTLLLLAERAALGAEDATWARHWVDRASAALQRVGRTPHEDIEWLRVDAFAFAAAGDRATAEVVIRRALARAEPSDGLEHAELSIRLANLLDHSRASEARALLENAASTRRAALGRDHPLVAAVEFNLGLLDQAQGDYVSARAAFERARDVQAAVFGADAPRLATMHVALAGVDAAEGKYQDALAEADRALTLVARSSMPERSVAAEAHRARADAFLALGDRKAWLEANLAVLDYGLGVESERELAPVRINVGEALCAGPRCAEARPHYQLAIDAWSGSTDEEARRIIAYATNGIGKVELSTAAPSAALASFHVALEIVETELHDPEPNLVGEIHWGLAQAYCALGEPASALRHAKRARALYDRVEELADAPVEALDAFLASQPCRAGLAPALATSTGDRR